MPISSADPNTYLAIGMQSALGTPQVTATKLRYAKYLSGTDAQAEMDIVYLREGGDGLDWGYSYKRQQKAVGQIVINARPEIAGQFLQIMPGGATWSGASAPAVHTFHTGHASFPYSTLLVQHPGSTLEQLLSDVVFTGFTMEAQSGEPVKLTFPFVAIKHGASYADLTPTYYTEQPFLFHHSPTYVLDGSGDAKLMGFKLEFGLGIEELQTQAVSLDDIVVQNRDGSVEITRQYVDATNWKKINMGAGVAATTSVATGSLRADQTYDTGASARRLRTEVPLIAYSGLTVAELDPDGKTVLETIQGKALKGATSAVIFYVDNGHASAYGP